jgi:hypothetical protein
MSIPVTLTEELLEETALGDGVVRKLHGDLAYKSEALKEALAEVGVLLQTEPAERRPGRVFGLGETLARTLVGVATRIAAKVCAYTYAFLVNRMMGRPQGHITRDPEPADVLNGWPLPRPPPRRQRQALAVT